MSEVIGALLNERYRLDAEVGRGGMGVVYRALDTLLERPVAVKVMSAAALGTEGRARLLREAQVVAKLNHPNIVTVYDIGEADDAPFIVMEFVEGTTLYEQRPESLEEILAITYQVCAALEHAHAHGIIHRDLKPENVLLAPDRRAKLVDFGLARSVASRLTSEGTIVGTVFYLAPELALGQDFDGRADLYALGVMLYELTTGRLPFTADDPVAVISQHLHAPVVPPRAKNPQIPPALDTLIVRLLSKAPADRPASATEVLHISERPSILEKDAVPAEELSVLERIERGRMVGRKQEMQLARALWNRALSGQGQMLLISGEPGIGKTRLVRELVTQVEVSGGRALVGTCYAEGGAPYTPFAQMLRNALHNGSRDGLDLPEPVLADLLALTPDLRHHYPDVPANLPLDPQAEQQRLFENMVSFCRELSERAPLLLVLDDAHWADSGTLFLLRHLARRTRRQRLLIVATYREADLDEARPLQEVLLDFNRERLATRLELARLGREGTKELLAALFDEEITPAFLDGIYRETEGNPFFIEEVSKALVESGKLYYEDGRWHRPSMDELEIPESVRVAIQSRVRVLPTDSQETLRLAAILGREFDFDTLAEASDLDEDALIDALERAEAAQLIGEVSGEGSVTFAFAHALIPATLAEGVRTLRRRRLHHRAAAAIETLRPDDFEALAYHYGEAGDEERALIYYARAGERASAAYANREAEHHYLAALDLVDSEADQAHLLSELGEVQARQSRYEDAIETWNEGIDVYKTLGDQDGAARLYARAARASWHAGDTPRGLTLCREGMTAVAGTPETPGLAYLLHETARACFLNGLRDEAVSLCRQALEMAERLRTVKVQTDSLITLGLISGQSTEASLAALTQAIELAESAGLLTQAARAHNDLAIRLGFNAGDIQAVRQHFLHAAELSRKQGAISPELFYSGTATYSALIRGDFLVVENELPNLHRLLEAATNPGPAALQLQLIESGLLQSRGKLVEGIQRLGIMQREARQVGDLQFLSAADITIAEGLLEIGEVEEAETGLREAIDLGDRGSVWGGVWPRCILSIIRSRQGAIVDARSLISEGREKAAGLGDRAWDAIWLSLAGAHLAAAEENWPEAWGAFEDTADGFARMGMRWYRARTLREWAEAHLSRGGPEDNERARELLREAQGEFEQMGIPFYAAQIEEQLKDLEAK